MNNTPPPEIWVTLAGSIDQQMVQKVFQFFSNAVHSQVKKAHLLIQSGGGFVSDGVCLYNYLKNHPIEITAYNTGNISSIAVIVYLAASRRIAEENATFMIHKTHATPPPGQTAAMLKEIGDNLNIDNARTEAILHAHLSLPQDKWILHEHGNYTFTAKEGMDFALVHELGSFAPPQNGQLFNIYP